MFLHVTECVYVNGLLSLGTLQIGYDNKCIYCIAGTTINRMIQWITSYIMRHALL